MLTALNTDAGIVLGTVTYMSPEQTRGQEVDARTDLWSLGVILYEMVTGRNPFAAPSSSEVLAAILDREPAPITRFEPDAPTELQRIVRRVSCRRDHRAAGWLSGRQQDVIGYLVEENRVLRAQLRGRRLRLTDDQRRCLAVRGHRLGRGV